MSTTIKRIALVAVAALSLGVVSVAPSQAAANTLLVYTSGDGAAAGDLNTGTGVAGAFNYVTVTADTWSATAGNDYVITTDSSILAATAGTIATDKKSLLGSTLDNAIQIATPAVGTVTVSYWKRTGGVLAATAAETVVITVNATKQSGSYSAANSTAFIVSGETNTVHSTTADAAVTAIATADITAAAATIQISLKDALKAAYADTVTATVISGGANVKAFAITDSTTAVTANATAGTFSDSAYASTGNVVIGVFANGTTGPAVIRLTNSAGTEIAKKTVTFSSTTVATISVTVKKKTVLASTNATTGVFAVSLKDASTNAVNNSGTLTATPATGTTVGGASTCAWNETDTVYYCQVVGLAADKFGPVEYTFTHSSAAAAAVNAKASTTFSSNVASTLTIAGGSGLAGGDVVYTVTAKDANGYAVPDGTAVGNYISSVSTVGGIVKEVDTTTATSVDGVFTVKGTAPIVSTTLVSTFNLSGTAGAASTYFVKALAGTKPTAEFVVANASQDAAIDAANEAATAAQDATDAAIQAADAADEATAAVAALQLEVNTLIAGLKKQLTTLTNLVKNLAKAVAKK
jgi:hypothetical protein